jgi:LysR family transcriptional regulator for bpeEF and oprC
MKCKPVTLFGKGVIGLQKAGLLEESASLIAGRIGDFQWVVCGSPEYLAEYGAPQSIDDLVNHHSCRIYAEWHRTDHGLELFHWRASSRS